MDDAETQGQETQGDIQRHPDTVIIATGGGRGRGPVLATMVYMNAGAFRFPTGWLFDGADGQVYLATFFDGERVGDSWTGWEWARVDVAPEGIVWTGEWETLRGGFGDGWQERLLKGEGR